MALIGAGIQASASKYAADKSFEAQMQTNEMNYVINKQNNAANANLANQQNRWNVEQWERENDYNSPAAQAERLKGIGMSSSAIAQSVANVPASSLQSADLANQQAAQMQAPSYNWDTSGLSGMNIIGAARELQALRNETAQADMATSEAEIKPSMLLSSLDVMQAHSSLMVQQFEQNAKAFPTSLRAMQTQIEKTKADTRLQGVLYDLQKTNHEIAKTQLSFLPHKTEKEIQLLGEQIKKTIADAHKSRTSAAVDVANVGNINADTANKQEQHKIISNEAVQSEIATDLAKFGLPKDAPMTLQVAARIASGKMDANAIVPMFESVQKYLDSAHSKLTNPNARWFLENVIDEGSAARNKQGLYTAGSLQELIDDYTNAYHKTPFGKFMKFSQDKLGM